MKLQIALTAFVVTLTASAAVPLRWTVETSRVQPAQIEAYHGETLRFEAALQSYGKPFALTNNLVAIYWQTNGMDTAYWVGPAVISNHVLLAEWVPAMDVGATVYQGFIGAPGEIYRASFQLRLRPSPGAVPSELPLPVRAIDFAQVEVRNAPYYTQDETDATVDGKIASAVAPLRSWQDESYGPTVVLLKRTMSNVTSPLFKATETPGPGSTIYSWYAEGFTVPWSKVTGAPAIPTDSTVSDWGYLKTESDPTVAATIAPIETTVNAWQTYWDGDDVRVTVTNYYGSLDLPSLYLEQKITEGGTNYYKTIWTEKAMLNIILDRLAQLKADVDTKADRAWGFYDSHTGEYAPDGFTSISSGAILVSKDMSYQKTVTTGGGEVWVLTANDPTVITGMETNGFFRITDSEGNNVFEVVKGDKRVVPATMSAVAAGNNSLTITYNVVSQEHPSIEICDDLVEQDWKAEDDAGCPATVVWGGSSGAHVATVTGRQAMSKMFVKGTYEIGGETYIRNGAPVAFEKVILGGVTYRVTVETVNNKQLMVLTEL